MTETPLAADAAVDAYGFLSSILAGIAQPVWVVDPAGDIRFTNPAAIAALGYDDAAELEGKPSHQTIHYKHPDGTPYPVEECSMLRPRKTGETIHSVEDWFVRRDGAMFPVEYWSAPIDPRRTRGGGRLHGHRGASSPGPDDTRARHRRGARDGSPRRATSDHRGGRRGARAGRA
jgi:PAS domain S-box-containing protein